MVHGMILNICSKTIVIKLIKYIAHAKINLYVVKKKFAEKKYAINKWHTKNVSSNIN